MLLFLCFLPIAFSAEGVEQEFKGAGKVTAYRLNVRRTPSLDSDVAGRLDRGEAFVVHGKIGEVGGWLRISAGEVVGYVRNRPIYISFTSGVQNEGNRFGKKQTSPKKQRPQPLMEKPLAREGTDFNKHKGSLKKITTDLGEHRKKVESISQKEVEALEALNEIDNLLNRTRLHASAISREIEAIEGRIQEIEHRRGMLMEENRQNKALVKSRLKALYRIQMNGKNQLSRMPDSMFDFIISRNSLKRILENDFSVLDEQLKREEELKNLEDELGGEKKSHLRLNNGLLDQIRTIKHKKEERSAILKNIREKKSFTLAAMDALKLAAERLTQKMKTIGGGGESNFPDEGAFKSLYGALAMPVQGRIISKFGSEKSRDHKTFTFQSGIDIKVERGEPVKAVFKGNVVYAQWLKGYGNLIIINHGDSYYTLYAHVEEMFKKRGEPVDTGDVIATAGDTGSIKGLCLHFEVRHHDTPVDPLKWFKKGV